MWHICSNNAPLELTICVRVFLEKKEKGPIHAAVYYITAKLLPEAFKVDALNRFLVNDSIPSAER